MCIEVKVDVVRPTLFTRKEAVSLKLPDFIVNFPFFFPFFSSERGSVTPLHFTLLGLWLAATCYELYDIPSSF